VQVIENNFVHGTTGAGIFLNGNESNHFGVGPTDIHLRYNIITVNTSHGAIRIYDGQSGKDPKDVKIYGNYNSTSNGGFLIDQDLGNVNSLRVLQQYLLQCAGHRQQQHRDVQSLRVQEQHCLLSQWDPHHRV
jgi:hypothetical protein